MTHCCSTYVRDSPVGSFQLCLHPIMPGYGGRLGPVVLLQALSLFRLEKVQDKLELRPIGIEPRKPQQMGQGT